MAAWWSLPSRSMCPPERNPRHYADVEQCVSCQDADREVACVTCKAGLCEDCALHLGEEYYCDSCAMCQEPECAAQADVACEGCGQIACYEHSCCIESSDEAVGYREMKTICAECWRKARRAG